MHICLKYLETDKLSIMKKEHPNVAILKNFDPTNIAAAANILAEDAVFHYFNPKLPDLEGNYIGLKGFQEFFNKIGGLSKGTFKVNPVSIFPVGDELVVVQSINTMTLEDRQIEVDVVVVWRIVNGKIAEVWDIPSAHTAKVMEFEAKMQQ
jgi:predicted SnoaL-like aldol condensation-catalyzing enzyme